MSSSDNVQSSQVADSLASLAIHTTDSSPHPQQPPQLPPDSSRPFIMYSRSQLLFLSKSPLVQLPTGMPALKDWFGTESDQSGSKKDSETPLPVGNTRDRRFRRDADDTASARQSFRGAAITQPSQMGNFKHQSIRAAERDRDRDTERDQDRERVKEGQERLRNLSDKYDRDRRALSSISQIRAKDRELVPHLANASSRVTAQSHPSASSRANDSRDPQRKKDGESNEDWRRSVDQPRTGRDRPENVRRDRDDRERPRSRVRDASRSRRDGSLSRRDKEDRRTDRDDGYAYRKDRDDRDKDLERESELDDPRRWRDDGKRDERMAARREREIRDRERERELRDRRDRPAWDGDRSDRRWAAADDRDSRSKRSGGRDRKLGEDGKDRDDRKDREREKEPAWMDTYIPSNGSSGVIGGQRPGGELDGIQAFRKEMQQKDKPSSPGTSGVTAPQTQASSPGASESQLDEIQLFRLMMKREEEKKKSDSPVVPPIHTSVESPPAALHDDTSQVRVSSDTSAKSTLSALSDQSLSSTGEQPEASVIVTTDISTSVPSTSSPPTSSLVPNGHESELSDRFIPHSSRAFSNALPSDPPTTSKPTIELTIPANQTLQSHPPGGSRLLALGSRNPQNTATSSARSSSSQSPASSVQKNANIGPTVGAGVTAGQPIESPSPFTPMVETLRSNNEFSPFDEHRDPAALSNPSVSDTIHRGPMALTNDRTIFSTDHVLTAEPGLGGFSNSLPPQSFEPASGIAAAKGSRFAKFFDGKSRDNQPASFTKGSMGASVLSQPTPQKPDLPSLHPVHNSEGRTMEDIFAMLNNSAQAQRLGIAPELPEMGYGSPSNNLHALQNPQSHSHLLSPSRMDSLYDDRNFVPDGMVPGLRSAPPPRSRQNSAMFSDFTDEPVQFNGQRAPTQVFQGPVPSIHIQHGNIGRNGSMSMQAAQFRGAPSPSHLASVQRLPPGLANLGGRPPHEPGQFVNASVGMTNGGLHGTVHGNGSQPPFNNFQQPSLGFNGGHQQIRAPHPTAHQLQGTLGPSTLQGLIHPGNLGSTQAQLMGLTGANGMPGGLRGPSGGFGQQGPQVQPPHIALRQHQQAQQQLPPHLLPLHLQQQSFGGGATNQPAHDLMALLMNGARRD